MKKSERLHHMLRFINQKQHFTLPDLMQEFQISKRTALRDIASLEEMGAPIYVEYGRYGGYRLLQQMQLPPISFNTDELHALYFAMQALRSFTSLPFQTTFDSVHEKFMAALSDRQQENIHNMQQRVAFKHTEQIKDSAHLELLLKAAVQQIVIQITYHDKNRSAANWSKVTVSIKNKEPTQENLEAYHDQSEAVSKTKTSTRVIQPIALYTSKGYWYCQAYDLKKKAPRVFRCDRIISAVLTEIEPVIELDNLRAEQYHFIWKPSEQAISFQCRISKAGMERFQQNHYPSMRLEEQDGVNLLIGTYEPHELEFIVIYLAGYGTSIKIVEPEMLKESLRQYYMNLLRCI
ncbi:YafY family transcriptional regulator [Paenibacillus polysaccharolyticus]|uniref:helix-turn-helix transcriptional regulator n=1 Tax=Paenibacillus polysaccharolyticus TaxID=582692 RepID=UPI00203AADF4|nr:YafY family protein [Paenibacillus polysaccharolyticus]MCM3136153.1 YafY family transcriptional regulator [Paenibacillus polysaccharolyticus]